MCQKPIVFDPRCHVHGASSPATPIAQVSNFVLRRWLACGCATDLSSDRQPAAAMVRRRSSNPNCTSRQSPFDVPSSIFMLTNIRDNTKSAESIESGDPPSERARSVANIYSQPPHPTRSLGKAGRGVQARAFISTRKRAFGSPLFGGTREPWLRRLVRQMAFIALEAGLNRGTGRSNRTSHHLHHGQNVCRPRYTTFDRQSPAKRIGIVDMISDGIGKRSHRRSGPEVNPREQTLHIAIEFAYWMVP